MQHFPIFLDLDGRRVVLSGGGEAALAKLRLLLKIHRADHRFRARPGARDRALGRRAAADPAPPRDGAGRRARCRAGLCRDEDAAPMTRAPPTWPHARACWSTWSTTWTAYPFITPAIVDRDPVTVAIGTEGAAPVLARRSRPGWRPACPRPSGAGAHRQGFRGPWPRPCPSAAARRLLGRLLLRRRPPRLARAARPAVQDTLDDLLASIWRRPPPGPGGFRGRRAGRPRSADAEGAQGAGPGRCRHP